MAKLDILSLFLLWRLGLLGYHIVGSAVPVKHPLSSMCSCVAYALAATWTGRNADVRDMYLFREIYRVCRNERLEAIGNALALRHNNGRK